MSQDSTRVASTRALRFVICLLAITASSGCASKSPSAYMQAPRTFPGIQLNRTQAGGFSLRILSGMVSAGPPLYIVDGIRVTVEPARGIDWFQPEDIVAIQVLKDPSEIAVYGQSGTNGVVLITTRQGLKPVRRAPPLS